MAETRKQLNLGAKSAKYLPKLYGDRNPMRDPEIVSAYKKQITGRKRQYREDGSWYWTH
jgi:hypothetical protein